MSEKHNLSCALSIMGLLFTSLRLEKCKRLQDAVLRFFSLAMSCSRRMTEFLVWPSVRYGTVPFGRGTKTLRCR